MGATSTEIILTSDREIVMSRTFEAPRALVYAAWTDPEHLPRWWGPRGFTTTTRSQDVRAGGGWRYVMHGPDGRDYENIITYLEVVAPERLSYKHGGAKETEPVNFEVTVTFEALGPERTKVTMRSIFPSKNARDFVINTYGALEGGKQTLERLGEHLVEMAQAAADSGGAGDEFLISRVFRAPREAVFGAWTQRDQLARWFGPRGVTTARATLDLRTGGLFHYQMRTPDGTEMWGKWVFREIAPPSRLVFVTSFSDEHAGLTRHPLNPDWPRELLTVVTFVEHAGIGRGTLVTVRWSPIDPTPVERATFESGRQSMSQGWAGLSIASPTTWHRASDHLRSGGLPARVNRAFERRRGRRRTGGVCARR